MNVHDKPTTGSLILLVLCASGAATLAPLATAPARAEPVVQPLPGEGPPTLSSALLRLGRNPHDTAALIDAGNAALAMGDTDAATGFFTRADRLMPNNAAIQAGLAGARVRAEDPFGAIPLFQSAERNGAIPVELLSDRGLAYDLVADNASAQKYYRQAIAASAGDEATRRLAVSLAIAGDRRRRSRARPLAGAEGPQRLAHPRLRAGDPRAGGRGDLRRPRHHAGRTRHRHRPLSALHAPAHPRPAGRRRQPRPLPARLRNRP